MHRYYLIMRPAMPGAVPTRNLEMICNFDNRMYAEEIGREAWGWVEYTEPLTEQEIKDYELVEVKK